MTKLHAQKGVPLRAPQTLVKKSDGDDGVTFENYDDVNYGYLRVIADPKQLRIEYHPASDTIHAKSPDDSVTVDLTTRKRTVYTPNDLGYPGNAQRVRTLHAAQVAKGNAAARRKRTT